MITIQLLAKDEHFNDESITSEEKWSLYVDHFVQLSATEGVRLKRREPFLKRNLPTSIPEEPPQNIETQSGLELKICVNTYKIFFVDNTEDYFRRKFIGGDTGQVQRRDVFKRLCETGWMKFMDRDDADQKKVSMDQFLLGSEGLIAVEEIESGRRFKYLGQSMVEGQDDDEDEDDMEV